MLNIAFFDAYICAVTIIRLISWGDKAKEKKSSFSAPLISRAPSLWSVFKLMFWIIPSNTCSVHLTSHLLYTDGCCSWLDYLDGRGHASRGHRLCKVAACMAPLSVTNWNTVRSLISIVFSFLTWMDFFMEPISFLPYTKSHMWFPYSSALSFGFWVFFMIYSFFYMYEYFTYM